MLTLTGCRDRCNRCLSQFWSNVTNTLVKFITFVSECYYTCYLYYICAFNTRLRLNYFGIFRNLEELLEILWTFSFMVFCFFSQKALHLKLHHKWFWSLCFQSLAASISGFFHIIQHPLPPPPPSCQFKMASSSIDISPQTTHSISILQTFKTFFGVLWDF